MAKKTQERQGYTRRTVEFRTELVDFTDEHFPKSFWWLMNVLLEEFKTACGDGLPKRYAEAGARELADKLGINQIVEMENQIVEKIRNNINAPRIVKDPIEEDEVTRDGIAEELGD